jgi:hypothetical protein
MLSSIAGTAEQADQISWQMFEAERSTSSPMPGRSMAPASVSNTCTVRFDNNKYSVISTAVGRPVEVHAYAGGRRYAIVGPALRRLPCANGA